MTKIRLPISEFDEEFNQNSYKNFIRLFIMNSLNELKLQLSSYHKSKEIECRKKLIDFFKQKISDFELLYLMDIGIQYLSVFKNIDSFNYYEDIANRLAFVFENLKLTVSPSWNVKASLENLYTSKILSEYPDNSAKDIYLERLIKIYLEKENLDFFDSIKVEKNLVILNDKHKIALCGELVNPKFVLIDSNIHIKDFTFGKFTTYLKLENKYFDLFELHKKFKSLKSKIDLVFDGGYLNFKVIIDNLQFEANENIGTFNLDQFILALNSKYKDLHFSLDDGWYSLYNCTIEEKQNVNRDFTLQNEQDISFFIKNNYYDKAILFFPSPMVYITFLEFISSENNFFKIIECAFKDKKFFRNKKEIIFDNITFKFISIKNNIVKFDSYAGDLQFFIQDHFLTFEKKSNNLSFSEFDVLIKNRSLLLLYDLQKYVNQHDNSGNKSNECILKLKNNYLQIEFDTFLINIHNNYIKVLDYKITDPNLYLKFLFNIYKYKEKTLRDLISVQIHNVIFTYNINENKILSNIKNQEIYNYRVTKLLLQNLLLFYTHGIFPDFVAQDYAIFYLDLQYKIYFSNETFESPQVWFKSLKKTVNGNSNVLDLSLENFYQIYKKCN